MLSGPWAYSRLLSYIQSTRSTTHQKKRMRLRQKGWKDISLILVVLLDTDLVK